MANYCKNCANCGRANGMYYCKDYPSWEWDDDEEWREQPSNCDSYEE